MTVICFGAVMKALRIIVGILVVGFLLHLATLATQDCTVGVYVYEICFWLRVREYLGLPASGLLRAGALEVVGLALAAGIYLTIRYVFPPWRAPSRSRGESET